ncbi:MAG: methyltransferase domain-containing protein [Anaerolineae bacterium]
MPAESDTPAAGGRDLFEDGAATWDAYTRAPHGRMREALILHHLREHLPVNDASLSVLDAGAGTGGYSLALASLGHAVVLVDYAPAMLALARSHFTAAGAETLARAEYHCAPIDELPAVIACRRFDVLLVHTLLEYVREPWRVLRGLLDLVAPGGLVSLVTVNEAGDVLRLGGPRNDPGGALKALHGGAPPSTPFEAGRTLLSLERCKLVLGEMGFGSVNRYGIRVFGDSYEAAELADPELYASVMALELETGWRDPFRLIGRYHQLVGVRS